MKVKSDSEVTQSYLTLSDPMDLQPTRLPSMGFSRQEYWSGVPLPSPLIYLTMACLKFLFNSNNKVCSHYSRLLFSLLT